MCFHNGLSFPCNQCGSFTPPFIQPCPPPPCNNSGCLIQEDATCILYHKDNATLSQLINLGLPNGSSVSMILEAIDAQLGNLQFQNFTLPCLRTTFSYVINTGQQFAQAVDTTLCVLNTAIAAATAAANTPNAAIQTNSVHLTLSGTLNRTIRADVNISATANNDLQILSDGLYAQPQTLSANYTTNQLTISNGNTINLPNFAEGYLGNVTADPGTAVDGNYWWRTDTLALRIRVNGVIKTITTT